MRNVGEKPPDLDFGIDAAAYASIRLEEKALAQHDDSIAAEAVRHDHRQRLRIVAGKLGI